MEIHEYINIYRGPSNVLTRSLMVSSCLRSINNPKWNVMNPQNLVFFTDRPKKYYYYALYYVEIPSYDSIN